MLKRLSLFSFSLIIFFGGIGSSSAEDQYSQYKDAANYKFSEFKEVALKIKAFYGERLPGMWLYNSPAVNFDLSQWNNDNCYDVSVSLTRLTVNLCGGFTRHPTVTLDVMTTILCHEMGHHMAGWPNRGQLYSYASSEAQSDYFSSQSCLRDIWSDEDAVNSTFKEKIPEVYQKRCDSVWELENQRNLCYRIIATAEDWGIAHNEVRILKYPKQTFSEPVPSILKTDTTVAEFTIDGYPSHQCRVDTIVAGALCNKNFNLNMRPTDRFQQGGEMTLEEMGYDELYESAVRYVKNSDDKSERIVKRYSTEQTISLIHKFSCTRKEGYVEGVRPRCWFNPDFLAQ